MNVLVDSGSAPHNNHGDNAMLVAAVERIHEIWPDARFNIISDDAERLKLLLPGLRVHALSTAPLGRRSIQSAKLAVRGRPRMALARFRQPYYRRVLPRASLVIATGGGYLRDRFETHAERTLELMRAANALGIPAAMMGQGPGTLSGRTHQLATEVIPRVDLITLRQGRSALGLIQEWGAHEDRVLVTGDDAVGLAHRMRPTRLGAALGLNLRLNKHSEVSDALLRSVQSTVGGIVADLGTELIPVPISFSPRNRDPEVCRAVIGSAPWRDPAGVLDGGFHRPQEVIQNVGLCRVVITGSYHGAVFALAQGVPAICVSASEYYDDKFGGLKDGFGEGCITVHGNAPDFPDRLRTAVGTAWASAPRLRDGLLAAAADQSRSAADAYRSLSHTVSARLDTGAAGV